MKKTKIKVTFFLTSMMVVCVYSLAFRLQQSKTFGNHGRNMLTVSESSKMKTSRICTSASRRWMAANTSGGRISNAVADGVNKSISIKPKSSTLLDTNPVKGTRDFYPEDMRLRNWLFDQWRRVGKLYGFSEYDSPVLESEALYTRKAGEEVTQQLYNFVDKGAVPYRGTGPAMTDVMASQVDIMCDQTTNTTAQIEAGKVKAFAVTTPRRLSTPALSKLPTLDESGLKGFNVSIWHGLYAPKGTPAPILAQMNKALQAALKDPAFVKSMESLGAVIVTDNRVNPAEHKRFVEGEIAKWGPIIKAAGQYAD